MLLIHWNNCVFGIQEWVGLGWKFLLFNSQSLPIPAQNLSIFLGNWFKWGSCDILEQVPCLCEECFHLIDCKCLQRGSCEVCPWWSVYLLLLIGISTCIFIHGLKWVVFVWHIEDYNNIIILSYIKLIQNTFYVS